MPQTSRARRRALVVLAGDAASAALPSPAPAQSFPAKPITLICPWPPGGSTDRHLRRPGMKS